MKISNVFMLGLVSVVASLMLVKVNGEELKVPRWQTQAEIKNGLRRWQTQHNDPKTLQMKNRMQRLNTNLRVDNMNPKHDDLVDLKKKNKNKNQVKTAKKCPKVNRDSSCSRNEDDPTAPFFCLDCPKDYCECAEDNNDNCYCVPKPVSVKRDVMNNSFRRWQEMKNKYNDLEDHERIID